MRWTPPNHDETLFEGTAKYYSRYRLGYNDRVFDYLNDELALRAGDVALDLGCGTGQVAIPLAQRGIVVYAVDPDVEMLREGLLQEKLHGLSGVRWIPGSDRSLPELNIPPLNFCTMGASFHWMDRSRTLEMLDGSVVRDGAVVLLDGSASPWGDRTSDWQKVVKAVVESYLGKERRAGKSTYQHPETRHETVLEKSAFHNVTKTSFESEIDLSADQIIGLQLSTSYASPALLGDRIDAFRADLMRGLLSLAPGGRFPSKARCNILIGRR
jgi:ubiquinone/menaquinone biosynthesis C-methylase UbiE